MEKGVYGGGAGGEASGVDKVVDDSNLNISRFNPLKIMQSTTTTFEGFRNFSNVQEK